MEVHKKLSAIAPHQIGKHSTLVIFSQKVQKNAALVQFPKKWRRVVLAENQFADRHLAD
jgi:hypothetical protein